METYRREEKTKTETTLHQRRGWTTGNPKTLRRSRQKTSRKRQQKSHRKTDRNSSKPRWPRSQQTLHNNTKQLCGKIFSGNTKVKDENDITSCIRKKMEGTLLFSTQWRRSWKHNRYWNGTTNRIRYRLFRNNWGRDHHIY